MLLNCANCSQRTKCHNDHGSAAPRVADCLPPPPQVRPDYIFLSTWNEHIAQKQVVAVPPYSSMGLESDPSSAQLGFVGALSVELSGVLSTSC